MFENIFLLQYPYVKRVKVQIGSDDFPLFYLRHLS